VSLCFLSDDWDDAWVQVDGTAEVLTPPEALDAFVEHDRSIAGEPRLGRRPGRHGAAGQGAPACVHRPRGAGRDRRLPTGGEAG
jgi:hypothetical protein